MEIKFLFLIALAITILIETGVLFLIVRKFFNIKKDVIEDKMLLFSGFITSFSTISYLWFVLPLFLKNYTLIGELLVFIVEAIMYMFILKLSLKKATLISFFCNATSYFLGNLIFVILGF